MPDSFGYRAAMSQSTDPGAAIRWGERLPVDLPVSILQAGAEAIPGRLLNVSVSGALIEADAQLQPPAVVSVAIDTAIRGRDQHLRLEAVVVRCSGGYLGLEWRDMASQPLVELLQASDS
jgi:hypothetical protein